MIAIIVLTALMLLAIPFAAFMRRQHAAGTQALHSARAESGEAGALSHAQAALGLGQPGAENSGNPFPYDNPQVDTLWEFRVTLRTQVAGGGFGTAAVSFAVDDALGLPNDDNDETIDGYIRVDNEWMAYSDITWVLPPTSTSATVVVGADHRGLFGTVDAPHAAGAIVSFFPDAELWTLDVEDPQSKININTAPYRVIRNLLGYLRIGGNSPEDPATGDPAVDFPSTDQIAIAQAIYSYRVDPVTLQPRRFASIDAVRNAIPLTAEEMDLLRPHVTVNSGYVVGADSWLSVGNLESDMTAAAIGGATNLSVANVSDASRIGVGSTVWLSWTHLGTSFSEFRTVLAKNGCGRPLVLAADCAAGDTSIDLQWAPGFVGASPSPPSPSDIPCYIKIDDEWIMYTDVTVDDEDNPTILTLENCVRNQFGTAPADHLHGIAYVDGDVICWENTLAPINDPPPLTDVLSDDCLVAEAPLIRVQNRHGVNANTCTDPVVLQSIFYDIDRYGDDRFGVLPDTANYVASELVNYLAGGDGDFFGGPSAEDWFDATDGPMPLTPSTPPWHTARDELKDFFLDLGAPLSAAQEAMLAHNASALTVPLQFNSGALLGLGSLAVADDRAGTPVAQSPNTAQLARLFDVLPPLTESMWQWRSQKEFYEHILATGGGKNVLTMPLNEGLLPPPDTAVATADYEDTTGGIGTVTPVLEELNPTWFTTMLEGLHEPPPWPDPPPNAFALDYSVAGDTTVVAADADFGNTTAEGITGEYLQYNTNHTDVAGKRHIEADSFLGTIQPFAIELWVKPDTGIVSEQLLVDIGAGSAVETAQNQVRLYMNPETTGGVTKPRLVLRLDDQVGAGCVKAWSSNDFDFDPGVWHHVAVAACGTFPHEIAMFIDGVYDRDMDWHYYYLDGLGVVHDEDATTVNEAYFWPVAMNVPVGTYTVAPGPDAGGWDPDPLNTEIGLTDISDLPPVGWVAINTTGELYEYNGFDSELVAGASVDTIVLTRPLSVRHNPGEPVTCMIPLVRPATHKAADDPESFPAGGDSVGFWRCADLGNGVFAAGASALASFATVDDARLHSSLLPLGATVAFPDYYVWLVFDPQTATDPIVAGVPGDILDVQQDRWKAFRYDSFVGSPASVLAGLLPSGAGSTIHVGADAGGLNLFEGEIDELRITALPSTMLQRIVGGGDWPSGSGSLSLMGWHYFNHAIRGYSAEEQIPPSPALVRSSTSPVYPSGGFFVVCDTPSTTATPALYSYQWYGAASLNIIEQREDDLSPAGVASTAQPHRELRPVMPLNLITSTGLAAGYASTDGDIPVVDASQFPRQGYVRIGDEIIGYSGKDTSGAPHLLLRPATAAGVSACPRGAYGTTEAGHAAGAVVGHLPVRHPDRYRAEDTAGTWDVHTTYSQAQLDAQMCMVSFPIYRAGKLKKVSWEFKEPLEDGQKVAVLVRIDDAVAWNANPYDDAAEDVAVFGSQNPETSLDLLWGTMSADPDPDGELAIYKWIDPGAGTYGYPTATSKVEVRFYFDLGDTHPYRYEYIPGIGPSAAPGLGNMIEIDQVQIEMEAESGVY